MEQIIRDGSVTRGWIGVGGQDITGELADSLQLTARRGALITQVVRDGPADQAGVKPGDVLVAVNGSPVGSWGAVLSQISVLKPGDQAGLKLLREQAGTELAVTIGRRPKLPRNE
jgi:serine protease DegQ